MEQVPIEDAQARLPDLLAAVARGDTVTILRDGLPVARLVPVVGAAKQPVTTEVMDALARRLAHLPRFEVDGPTLIDAMRDERELP